MKDAFSNEGYLALIENLRPPLNDEELIPDIDAEGAYLSTPLLCAQCNHFLRDI